MHTVPSNTPQDNHMRTEAAELNLVDTLFKIPTALVESNIRALCSNLSNSSSHKLNEREAKAIRSCRRSSDCQPRNSLSESGSKESSTKLRRGSALEPKTNYETKSSDQGIDSSKKKGPNQHNENSRRRRSSVVSSVPGNKLVPSQKLKFYEMLADKSIADIVDQEARLIDVHQRSERIRRQSLPKNILMVSGRGRHPQKPTDIEQY